MTTPADIIKRGEIPTNPASSSLSQPLPKVPGTYALFLHLPESRQLPVGGLGELFFPAGEYVYLGSAFGPGGLRARLGRHLRGDGTPHWHIDYLRKLAQASGHCYVIADQEVQRPPKLSQGPGREKLECRWSQALAALTAASIPAPGFGASDCTSRCPAHLVAFLKEIAPDEICSTLARSAAVSDNPHPLIRFISVDKGL